MRNPSGGPSKDADELAADSSSRDADARAAAVSALAAFASHTQSAGATEQGGSMPPLAATPAPSQEQVMDIMASTASASADDDPTKIHVNRTSAAESFLPSATYDKFDLKHQPQQPSSPSSASLSSNNLVAALSGSGPDLPFESKSSLTLKGQSSNPTDAMMRSSTGKKEDGHSNKETVSSSPITPRGKPEAMALRLAALQVEATRQELLAEQEQHRDSDKGEESVREDDDDQSLTRTRMDSLEDVDEDEEEVAVAEYFVEEGGVLANLHDNEVQVEPTVTTKTAAPPKKKAPAKKKKEIASRGTSGSVGKKAASSSSLSIPKERTERLLGERAPPMTEAEYLNLQDLLVQFCKVPLLNEFSRPVALLHPELMASYSKIVSHPIDLGRVCRGVRGRKYANTRDVRLDIWRVFSNCVKFHSHPHNKEALPSFVSIGLHLREYFNALWDEYMLPSDVPENTSPILKAAIARRTLDRKKRIDNSGVLVFSKKHLNRTKTLLQQLIQSGACVDRLDTASLWSMDQLGPGDVSEVVQSLKKLVLKLEELVDETKTTEDSYSLMNFYNDLVACVPSDVFEDNWVLRNRILNRIDRFFWKRCTPLHEANCRGVTQSSIWGNAAATIWARESSKKAFWPALCLGIMSPPDQRESWHATVTERNETRLPEKLRTQLEIARRKCEQAQTKQSYSYFLVEFLGTHEFIWVRETDIIDSFDPEDDPNTSSNTASKRKRTSRSATVSAVSSKAYATAVSECVWASEEYENILIDAFDEDTTREHSGDDDEPSLSFASLAKADDEADAQAEHGFKYEVDNMTPSDVEEANYLLAHDGATDFGGGKKKTQTKKNPPKKKAPEKDKKEALEASKKAKADLARRKVKAKEDKKEQKELERRRKKRMRDRDKALKEAATRKNKRPRSLPDLEEDDRGLATDKRARATAIVKAYLLRMANHDEDYRTLALNGVMTMPAAIIESTGLIGMALAFRAAAGELTMPDDNEEQINKSTRPWDSIDASRGITSAERSVVLEQQIKMLESEIKRGKMDCARRNKLTEEAFAQRLDLDQAIESDDRAARVNYFRKKKKMSPATGKSRTKNETLESRNNNEGEEENGSVGDDVEAELTVIIEGEHIGGEETVDTRMLGTSVAKSDINAPGTALTETASNDSSSMQIDS